ncbi:unnamed protein product [Linum trigynum]|uniref:Uncharacterized protein n=1 Tax=Linum trigynum TaxID=586398 RepID=A0AAV2GAJ2_9ROSI
MLGGMVEVDGDNFWFSAAAAENRDGEKLEGDNSGFFVRLPPNLLYCKIYFIHAAVSALIRLFRLYRYTSGYNRVGSRYT